MTDAVTNTSATSSTSTKSTSSTSSLDSLSQTYDTFLTLLTTQLQNQDPLNPMDSKDMTNQLVQFSSVEQQIKSNSNLEQMITLLNAQSAASSVSYIGKDVQYNDSTTTYSGSPVTFGYTPKNAADSLSIKVVDSNGKTVRTLDGERSADRHTVEWDGKDDDGNEVAQGQYTFVVSAKDADGKDISVDTDVTGHVTGSAIDSSGSYLLIGDLAVDVTKVVAVREPSASA